jgi:hypothetical protein
MMTQNESRISPIAGRYLMPVPDLSGPERLPGGDRTLLERLGVLE